MPSEVSTVTGEQSVEALRRELAEAREQQAATVEILASISSSVTDANQVFAKIAASAARLCDANDATIFQVDGDLLRRVANNASIPQYETRGDDTMPLTREVVGGRAVLDGKTIQVADVQAEMGEYPEGSHRARRVGHRTILAVPLMRMGEAIGVIAIRRTEVRQFTDRQIDLLKTFADQAVIAIENSRLFHETKEALERQTATAEILKVIASSPSDSQPVFNAIATSANRLLGGLSTAVWRFEGDKGYLAAFTPINATADEALKALSPMRISDTPGLGLPSGGKVVQLRDTEELPPRIRDLARLRGFRAMLFVPLMNQAVPIGCVSVTRKVPGAFDPDDVQLLQTFADQALIAIENARLFEEVQGRTKELTESLEYQTATSEVLSVISRSPDALQPVVDSISETAVRLCGAEWAFIRTLGPDGQYHAVSFEGVPGKFVDLMLRRTLTPGRSLIAARALLERRTIHVDDVFTDPDCSEEQLEIARAGQFQTVLAVPLLRAGEPIGVIVLLRTKVAPFSKRQIDLVSTFADQAVIAIENTRLFEEVETRTRELSEALEYQTATGDVLNVISRSKFDLQPVLDSIVQTAARLCACDMATIRRREGDEYVQLAAYGLPDEYAEFSRSASWHHAGRGSLVGRVLKEGKAVQIPDVLADPEYTLGQVQRRGGFRSILGVPLLRGADQIGIVVLMRRVVQPFSDKQIELVTAFADQAVIAIENTRLFEEVQARTAELANTVEDLEIASQHKSQFVANMSHELRTPLAAMLGYAELLQEGIYGAPPEKFLPILTRIRSNGNHLLGLINTVLDISKIEAGQFKLNVGDYALGSIVETVMVATESLVATKKLAFKTEVANGMPYGLGDEQRLTQVLLNLVGNAIKFTDAGEVRIAASAANGNFELTVSDTGPGIPREECEHIFEKFRQVDSSNTRAKGGTGLGLAIAREIVEMHGGRIWVESALGQGSTFRVELPVRAPVSGGAS